MCVCVLFQQTYKKLLPLYYPRTEEEEKASLPLIPPDIGNSEGEPVVPERQIRITEKPGILEGMWFQHVLFFHDVMSCSPTFERTCKQHVSSLFIKAGTVFAFHFGVTLDLQQEIGIQDQLFMAVGVGKINGVLGTV